MKNILIFYFLLLTSSLFGNGITVSNVSFDSQANEISFTLQWENSFSDYASITDVYDAAWVFIKYAPNGGDTWLHAEILDSVAVSGYFQYISYDDLGVAITRSTNASGTFGPQEFTMDLGPLVGVYQDFKVFAVEMVYADRGEFRVGDGTSAGRFFQDGNTSLPLLISNEDAITRGNGAGEFDQEGSSSTTDIRADFPKGFEGIFCMKYKITAQQYVDFLNTLTRAQQDLRVAASLSGTTASNKYVMTNTASVQDRNPIACDVNIGTGPIAFYIDLEATNPPNSLNDGANIALNHLSVLDILAYFDWSGLRPMTELEYEKFCRGTGMPAIPNEYAWGTDTWNSAGTIINDGLNNETTSNVGSSKSLYLDAPLRAGYAATSTSTRTLSGATFWGIMDMHNLGEFMYGIESHNFSFDSYGDGMLTAQGAGNVSDWTTGNPQLLSSFDPNAAGIQPISKGKFSLSPSTRSTYLGARGVRRIYIDTL